MTLEDAKTIVALESDAGSEPVVNDANLDLILGQCALADSEGLPPTDDDWAGAYDLKLAIAKVFDIKASKVGTDFDFSADGGNYKRSQKAELFRMRAREYMNRRNTGFEPVSSNSD